MGVSVELSRDECARRLEQRTHGRVAVTTPSGPHQIPVTYLVDHPDLPEPPETPGQSGQPGPEGAGATHDALTFATTPYSVLGTYGRDALVALEIDDLDETTRSGWSVVVRGRARQVTDPAVLTRVRAHGLEPWVGGNRPLHLQLVLDECELTGRAVGDTTREGRADLG